MSPPSPPPPPASSGSGEASGNSASTGASPSSSDAALTWLREQTYTPSSLHEHLALAVHALLLGHGFRPADTPSTSTSESQHPPLPADWAAGGYGGRYLHGRSALRFEIRAVPLGTRLRIAAVVVTENEDDDDPQTATLDLRVARFVRNGDSNESAGDPAQPHHLTDRLDDFAALAALVQVNIAHVLVPDSAKEGYEATASAPNTSANDSSSSSAVPAVGGSAVPPSRPRRFIPPVEGDPLRDPLRIGPPRMPVGVGGDRGDLYGRDDLLAPGLQGFPDPRAGIGAGMPGLGGGNLMGPRNFPGMPGVRPRPRGMPPGVPPGARYDPVGPGGLGPDNDIELPPGRNMRDPDEEPPPGMYW